MKIPGITYCDKCECPEWEMAICECGECIDCCTCKDDECDCEACQIKRSNVNLSAEEQALYEAENDTV